jgi:hypothetical protein
VDFELQDDLPGYALDDEWRMMLAEQARLLEVILTRIAETVASVAAAPQQEHLRRLSTLLEKTDVFLTTLAEHNLTVEQGHAVFQTTGTSPGMLPLETARRLQSVEAVNATLHANLTSARRYLQGVRLRINDMISGA